MGSPSPNLEIITLKSDMRLWSRQCRRDGFKIGFVPTMGALHEGHVSLVREAKERTEKVVVSIYVNPSQFAPHEDLDTYPRDNESDIEKLKLLGVDAVFLPKDLYNNTSPSAGKETSSTDKCQDEEENNGAMITDDDVSKDDVSKEEGKVQKPQSLAELLEATSRKKQVLSVTKHSRVQEEEEIFGRSEGRHETWVQVERLQLVLEGQSRPHFFRGVATVVTKLLNIVEPDVVIFGRKDYQQWRVICKLVEDLDYEIEIVGAPLVRETDGLALSSRNIRLSETQREQALAIWSALKAAETAVKNGETRGSFLEKSTEKAISAAGGRVDYVQLVDAESLRHVEKLTCASVLLVAAFYGSVRLIDNIELGPPQSEMSEQ